MSINERTGDNIKTKPSTTYADKFDTIDWSVRLEEQTHEFELCKSCGEVTCNCAK